MLSELLEISLSNDRDPKRYYLNRYATDTTGMIIKTLMPSKSRPFKCCKPDSLPTDMSQYEETDVKLWMTVNP